MHAKIFHLCQINWKAPSNSLFVRTGRISEKYKNFFTLRSISQSGRLKKSGFLISLNDAYDGYISICWFETFSLVNTPIAQHQIQTKQANASRTFGNAIILHKRRHPNRRLSRKDCVVQTLEHNATLLPERLNFSIA